MRLWHKELINVLPRQQLLGQWRECCLIAKLIKEKGHPNHLLVERIMDYPIEHFQCYSYHVAKEMEHRGYKVNKEKFTKYFELEIPTIDINSIFKKWHNMRYLIQCYRNLEEKYDCEGINENEFNEISKKIL